MRVLWKRDPFTEVDLREDVWVPPCTCFQDSGVIFPGETDPLPFVFPGVLPVLC